MKYYSLEDACKKVITDLAQAYGVKSAIDSSSKMMKSICRAVLPASMLRRAA